MKKSIIILSFIILSTAVLFAGDSDKKKKTQDTAAVVQKTQNANSKNSGTSAQLNNSGGVSFVNSSGDTLMKVLDDGRVVIGAAVANGNAALDVDALGNDKGMLLPRLSSAAVAPPNSRGALIDQSPGRYICTLRLNRAVALIRSNADTPVCRATGRLAGIAYQTGFNTPSYFCNVFRRHFGCTPGEYRNKLKPIIRNGEQTS